jgi:hypothetical protein
MWIEGKGRDALLGARKIFAKHGPVIFLATHGDAVHQLCCKFLADCGYSLSSLDALQLSHAREVLAIRHEA